MIDNLRDIWHGFHFGMQVLILISHLCACQTPSVPSETPAQQIVQL